MLINEFIFLILLSYYYSIFCVKQFEFEYYVELWFCNCIEN